MTHLQSLLDRLEALEFTVESRSELFGEPLPYLKAIATDEWARQLVLVAEEAPTGVDDDEGKNERDEAWRELIFAVAGLRHHLRGPHLPALGSPVLLALVDYEGKANLRRLVEEIAREYALFARVDINIVCRHSTTEEGTLDDALTSLLPRVREAIRSEATVASQDVERFWQELSKEIERTAEGLVDAFGEEATEHAVRNVESSLRGSREDDAQRQGDHRIRPVSHLQIENFRSFEHEEVEVPRVGIIHGANGSGKTSLCEALEILWSGRTHRIPEGVKSKTYEKHLRRDGRPFHLRCDCDDSEESVEAHEIADVPNALLGRTVLPQHAISEMASSNPHDRFRSFLQASGLDLPDFEERIGEVRRKTFEEANVALAQAEIEAIRAVSSSGLKHLRGLLGADFAMQMPVPTEVEGAAEALTRVTDGAYSSKPALFQRDPKELRSLLEEVDAALVQVRDHLQSAADPTPHVDAAIEALRRESAHLTATAAALRQVFDHLRSLGDAERPQAAMPPSSTPLPVPVAARWLAHVRGLERSTQGLRSEGEGIQDRSWRKRLDTYVAALEKALETSSAQELEAMVKAGQAVSAPAPSPFPKLSPALLEEAGFSRAPDRSGETVAALGVFHERLVEHAAALERLVAALHRHPGRFFSPRAARIMPALCEFELAREIAKPRGTVTRTREGLVTRLLDGRLVPLVRELVAALVRFEWYFEAPLGVAVNGRELRMWGLSSGDPKLDLRMMLNEAERTAVGIGWFLALHVLQPTEDRQILVLDDPVSGFDDTNKAAFVATLRSVLHMLKPKQFLITTHDDSAVALLEQELGEVDGWPSGFAVLRCARRSDGTSSITRERDGAALKADLGRELRMLSLDQPTTQSAA